MHKSLVGPVHVNLGSSRVRSDSPPPLSLARLATLDPA